MLAVVVAARRALDRAAPRARSPRRRRRHPSRAASPRCSRCWPSRGVAAAWAVPTLGSLAAGMDRADTLWYHMPLAAKFVQTGTLSELFRFDPIFFASFYPANSEVVHAAPILAFGRDFVSPLLNFGFLAIGLLASWCIGRPYGVAPQALIGGSIALGAEMLVEFQAGEALNDITGVAFVLAAAALLVNAYAASGYAGRQLAAKLREPVGNKAPARRLRSPGSPPAWQRAPSSPLLPLLVCCSWASLRSRRGFRVKAGAVFALGALVAGGYWYARNAASVGNPIPFTTFGPLDLPSPERGFELRPGFSVFHYITDWDVIADWFVPGLDESFGLLWPLTLLALVGGGIYALWRGGEPVLRMLGAVALATAVAYVFTPLTAGGEEGEPIAFVWNVRYIAPAAAVGLAILPCLPALRALAAADRADDRRPVDPPARHPRLARPVGPGPHEGRDRSRRRGRSSAFALIAYLRSRGHIGPAAPRRWAIGLTVVVLLGAIGAGYLEQRHYLERRYENTSPQLGPRRRAALGARPARLEGRGQRHPRRLQPVPLLRHRPLERGPVARGRGPRRGLAADPQLRAVARGSSTRAGTTTSSRRTTPYRPPAGLSDTKEALWTREDPAAKEILAGAAGASEAGERLRDRPGSWIRRPAATFPISCAAELNGDSVNASPSRTSQGGRIHLRRNRSPMIPILGTALLFIALSLIWGRALLHLLGQRRPTWVVRRGRLRGADRRRAAPDPASRAARPPRRSSSASPPSRRSSSCGASSSPSRGDAELPDDAPAPRTPPPSPRSSSSSPRPACRSSSTSAPASSARASTPTTRPRSSSGPTGSRRASAPSRRRSASATRPGPQSLTATVAEVTHADLDDAFNGLLVAIPVLAALAALAALGSLRAGPAGRRRLAGRAALPRRLLPGAVRLQGDGDGAARPRPRGRAPARRPPVRSRAGRRSAPCSSSPAAPSSPTASPASPGSRSRSRSGRSPSTRSAAAASRLQPVADAAAPPPGRDRRRGPDRRSRSPRSAPARLRTSPRRSATSRRRPGRLSSPVFPGEGLGIWPEGDFRVVRGDVGLAIPATLLALVAVVAGAALSVRRKLFAPLATLAAAAIIYAGARAFGSIYVEAKALAVLAPLVVLVALGGLWGLRRGRSEPPDRRGRPRRRLRDRRRGLDLRSPCAPPRSASTSAARRSSGSPRRPRASGCSSSASTASAPTGCATRSSAAPAATCRRR